MELVNYLGKFEKKKPLSKEQAYATEIYEYFNKQIPFVRLMVYMKKLGPQFVYETFQETIKSNGAQKVGLFIWKLKQANIIWKN